jgi:hypothetical protein
VYYWRVSASNVGGTSSYSSAFTFTTIISRPSAPVLLSPHDTATGVAISPAFTWNTSPTATSYTIQVSTSPSFASFVVNVSGITATSYNAFGLGVNATFYWRVSATNAGGTGSFSAPYSFSTLLTAPSPPTLISPVNSATGISINPTFTWNASVAATSYLLEVSTAADFSVLLVFQSTITDTSYTVSGLLANTQYYWRVSGANAAGRGSFSSTFSFTSGIAPPTLVSPHDTATAVALSPTLTWNASASATSYTLQVSTAADFSALVVNQSGIAATSSPVGPLAANTHYYWRVSATSPGGTSAYSSIFTFITAVTPPPAPLLISPTNAATGVSQFGTILIWHPSAGATSYRVLVSLTSDVSLGGVVDQSNITDTSFALGQLGPSRQYYWAVKPANAGGEGLSSAVYSFTTIVSVPQPPALISPANGATSVSPTNPTLIWHSSAGATSYTILVSTTANMSALVVNQSNITDTSFTLGVLSLGAQFYWAVRPANASGQGPISAVYSFTVITPPQPPTLISPANGATSVSPINPTWVWHSAVGATSYTLAVSTDANMTNLILIDPNISDTSFTLAGSMNYGTQYYWGIRPANASGPGVFSAVFSFTTIVNRPQDPPTLISPANGATSVSPNNPTLVWHSVAGATSYTLLVSTTADMSALILNRPNVTDTSSALGVLNSGTHYYWAVRPANAGGAGVFSTVFSFTTAGAATLVEYIKSSIPDKYFLDQNYPNPFNPSTMIPYSLPHRSIIRVSVYSLLGAEVAVLVNGERSPGMYEVRLDAGAFPSGVYLIRFEARPVDGSNGPGIVASRKAVLIK